MTQIVFASSAALGPSLLLLADSGSPRGASEPRLGDHDKLGGHTRTGLENPQPGSLARAASLRGEPERGRQANPERGSGHLTRACAQHARGRHRAPPGAWVPQPHPPGPVDQNTLLLCSSPGRFRAGGGDARGGIRGGGFFRGAAAAGAAEGADGGGSGAGEDAGVVKGVALRAGDPAEVAGDEEVRAVDAGVAGPAQERRVRLAVHG